MSVQSNRRRKNAYKDIVERFTGFTTNSSGWLHDLISNSMANSYEGYESGAGISPADAFSALFNYHSMLEQMEFNQMLQEDAQAFNQQMQESSQAFSALEAEKQRDWEEMMYNKYETIGAQVQQMSAAGLNPALLYGGVSTGSVGSGASAGSAGMASSPSSSASASSVGDVGAGISNLPGGQLMMEMLGCLKASAY